MTRIDLTKPPQTLLRTSFVYGAYGAGKTDFCSTYPKVAWIGSNREGGAETMRWMDRSRWYEPNVAPDVYAVENMAQMLTHLNKDIMPKVQEGRIKTIVLELSFYTDDLIRSAPEGAMGWTIYGDLEKHIIGKDEQWKRIPGLRIVYNAFANPEPDDKKPAGPLMAGKALARKLPAICDMIGYLRTEEVSGGQIDRILHLQPYSNFPARHRYGTRLPPFVRNPTYRMLEDLINGRAVADASGVVSPKALPAVPGLPTLK